ncbi:MAG: Tol-Pal system beta propeller repeat protein TolB [Gammaproteobacteria bacterium]|nr:Tol-Pal system beta propeller repeat protein TolB [Gammaproteobacteria bacterium]
MWKKLKIGFVIVVLNLACVTPSRAALTIDVTLWLDNATPISVVPFQWQGAGIEPLHMTDVISGDLQRSGRFAPMAEKDMIERPHDGREVNFATWRNSKMKYLVVGKVQALGNGSFQVQFQLMDVDQGKQMIGQSFQVTATALRRLSHHISDLIYQAITGERGAFDTYLAYITVLHGKNGKSSYQLAISDSDGYNEQILLKSSSPILRPAWSPDCKQLAYVSYASGHPQIYVQNIYTKQTTQLTNFSGSSLSPAWSPDGRRMAMSLSKDGNAEIYIMDLLTRSLYRITNNYAIDVEPTWSPDGRSLIFMSDRGGNAQLYKVAVGETGRLGNPARLTYDGIENMRPDVSPNGKLVAMVNNTGGRYRIAVLDLTTNQLSILSDGNLDESPSFSPNGNMIIYASQLGGKGVLAVVSSDGRASQKLRFLQGEVREPAWSPYKSDQ